MRLRRSRRRRTARQTDDNEAREGVGTAATCGLWRRTVAVVDQGRPLICPRIHQVHALFARTRPAVNHRPVPYLTMSVVVRGVYEQRAGARLVVPGALSLRNAAISRLPTSQSRANRDSCRPAEGCMEGGIGGRRGRRH